MRMLIVEDDKEIGNSLKQSFQGECFTVDLEEDGERGSYLARTNDYDIVILDNILPKKEGKEICVEIRAAGRSMPIIMLTVQSETLRKVDSFRIGVDDYVTKPFSFQELLARVKAVLRRPVQLQSETLSVDTLSLNIHEHTVKRGDRTIYLTRKEFQLLEYLMRNQGRVLSRGMIMEHVWDINVDPFSNTIETHILNLRRKVDRLGKNKLIHTVPGRGYKIDSKK